MAQKIINNGDPASAVRKSINDNFTELYGNNVPKNHASTDTTYGVGSATSFGHVKVQSGNGLNINGGVISMAAASTSSPGAVALVDNATTNDKTKAATAAALKGLADSVVKVYWGTDDPPASLGKNGDIYIKIEQ